MATCEHNVTQSTILQVQLVPGKQLGQNAASGGIPCKITFQENLLLLLLFLKCFECTNLTNQEGYSTNLLISFEGGIIVLKSV